jgi:hypothetical protein
MTDVVRLLLLPVLALIGWFASWARPRVLHHVARGIGFAIAVLIVALLMTGSLHQNASLASAHRWIAHGLVIVIWTAAPFVVGVRSQQYLSQRYGLALAFLLTTAVLFIIAILSSMTGYLGPGTQGPLDADTLRRFRALHYGVLPLLLLLTDAAWTLLFPFHGPQGESGH